MLHGPTGPCQPDWASSRTHLRQGLAKSPFLPTGPHQGDAAIPAASGPGLTEIQRGRRGLPDERCAPVTLPRQGVGHPRAFEKLLWSSHAPHPSRALLLGVSFILYWMGLRTIAFPSCSRHAQLWNPATGWLRPV